MRSLLTASGNYFIGAYDGKRPVGFLLAHLFPRIDLNRDGAVTKLEVARYKLSVEGDNFIERYDLNGDGKVTRKEFSGPTDAFRRADRNGDGIISQTDR